MENFWSNCPKFLPPDLGRIRAVLEKLGNPHLKLQHVIHVAGTNGKGSVVENLRAILSEAGHLCHIYSSPHLVCINERIKVAGIEISDQKLLKLKQMVDEAAGEIQLTWFDVLTCIAFLAFAETPSDYTLLETGLGGRFDATNVVSPFLTLITSISKDHQAQLGDTIEKITYEKAGIIKENVPVIVGCNTEEVQNLLSSYYPQFCGLTTGNYIEENQTLARAAARQLKIPDDVIEQGLMRAALKGRFQKLRDNIYVDGAHNEGGALALSHLISDFDKPVTLVVAMNQRKDIKTFLTAFQDKVDVLIIPQMRREDFYKAEDIAAVAEQMGFDIEVGESLTHSYEKAESDPTHIYVFTGSLHFVGEVLTL